MYGYSLSTLPGLSPALSSRTTYAPPALAMAAPPPRLPSHDQVSKSAGEGPGGGVPGADRRAAAVTEPRVIPSIGPFWRRVTASTAEFSGSRRRNAAGRPERAG
ncbi:MAG TPA: hypothetical protein VHF26_25225 [Trebonia sp.]|nr:hypothetical protein [Trebonia sp.]